MSYTLHYGQIWHYWPDLLRGALVALEIAVLAYAGGLILGTIFAALKNFAPRGIGRLVDAYVAFFMNTPQLVQIYFLYYALPDFGILLSSFWAVVLGMTLNAAAYLAEIQRAGFASVQRAELEASEVLGFSRVQQLRHVILPHVMKVLFPPLSSQFIIVTLGTSMAAIFGVEELTGTAMNINSVTFRSIEIFSVTALFYVAVTIVASGLLALFGRTVFRIRARQF